MDPLLAIRERFVVFYCVKYRFVSIEQRVAFDILFLLTCLSNSRRRHFKCDRMNSVTVPSHSVVSVCPNIINRLANMSMHGVWEISLLFLFYQVILHITSNWVWIRNVRHHHRQTEWRIQSELSYIVAVHKRVSHSSPAFRWNIHWISANNGMDYCIPVFSTRPVPEMFNIFIHLKLSCHCRKLCAKDLRRCPPIFSRGWNRVILPLPLATLQQSQIRFRISTPPTYSTSDSWAIEKGKRSAFGVGTR